MEDALIEVLKLPHAAGDLKQMTRGSAGFDLPVSPATPLPDGKGVILSHVRTIIGTGYAFAIPKGFEGQVRSRSSLTLNHGIVILNSPGTIDSDYRGELKLVLYNFGPNFTYKPGDRLAQLVISPIPRVSLKMVDKLPETERGEGGFGSTGM